MVDPAVSWLNANTIPPIASALATILLALFTWRLAVQTRRLAAQTELDVSAQARPILMAVDPASLVTAAGESQPSFVCRVKNVGAGPALNGSIRLAHPAVRSHGHAALPPLPPDGPMVAHAFPVEIDPARGPCEFVVVAVCEDISGRVQQTVLNYYLDDPELIAAALEPGMRGAQVLPVSTRIDRLVTPPRPPVVPGVAATAGG